MIYIFSAPRSGSTWLGKIFDSHPDVFYLHEPEIVDRGLDLLSFWAENDSTDEDIGKARQYLDRLMGVRCLRATGTRPFFAKRYRSQPAEYIRRGLIYVALAAELAAGGRVSTRVSVPDLASRNRPYTTVIKSVSALSRAERLIEAAGPSMRPVLLVRHPCGFVSSMLRGAKIGEMSVSAFGRLLHTRSAKRLCGEGNTLESANDVQRLTWNWLLSNAEAYSAVTEAGGAVVVYDTFAIDAMAGASALFQHVGLELEHSTKEFLHRSMTGGGGYYSVFQDPVKAAKKWQRDLSKDDIRQVEEIVTRDPLGQMFFR